MALWAGAIEQSPEGTSRVVEVAEALFARLDDFQPKLNAFCVIDGGGALAAARASAKTS